MLFNSIEFALFLPVVFLLYWFVFGRNLRLKENVLDVIEVKRNPDKFNKGLLEEKTSYFSSKEKRTRKYRIVLSSLSMEDM